MSKEYGTVLEGGGARGAYQVGAWRALRETDIRIEGAAGISVGTLDGAFICMDDFEKAKRIQENVSYSRVMDADDELMERLRKFSLKDISSLASLNVGELITGTVWVLRDSGFNIAPLGVLIKGVMDEEKIRSSDGELYMTTYSISDRHSLIANMKGVPEDAAADLLVASVYLIGFRQEQLDGRYYMGGGRISNVSVGVLLGREYKDVIVLRIYDYGIDTERRLEVPRGVNLYHMTPRGDLGDLLEFDRYRARRNILLGYFDGKHMLYGLAERVCYTDTPGSKPYHFGKMVSKIQSLLSYMKPELETTGETRTGWKVQKETIAGYRVYTEQIFPWLARGLKLREGWDYKELYLSILEDLVKQYRISRLKIYTVEEFLRLIHKKVGTAALEAMIPMLDNGTQV